MDLAEGHLKAVDFCVENKGTEIINLGTGQPYSVLDIVKTFEKVNNIQVPYEIGPRRGGDLPAVYADVSKAEKVLGWKAKRTLADMCRDSWNWQKNNPEGYE
jgi:UDP-glucose 4-epimerase